MTLQEAIDRVKDSGADAPYKDREIINGEFSAGLSLAIATILNAVVNGELTHSAPRQERHEAQISEEKALSDRLAASYAMSLNDKAKVKACPSLAAYRKARRM